MATRRRKLRTRRKNTHRQKKVYRLNGASPDSAIGSMLSGTSGGSRDPDSTVYHEHLHTSLQAFRLRKWRPLTPEEVPQSSFNSCRLLGGRPSSCRSRPSPPPSALRPCSVPLPLIPRLLASPVLPRVTHGNFDTLSPRIQSQLLTDHRPVTPNSTYGQVIPTKSKKSKEKKRPQLNRQAHAVSAMGMQGDDEDGKGLVDSDDDDDDDDDDTDDDDDEYSDESDDSDDDSISELEKGNEPPVDRHRKAPNLYLRPERLDHVYTPENKRDMRRFDFDAEKVDIPDYEFQCPVPSSFNRINFRHHAREGTDWRLGPFNPGTADPTLSAIFDRLVDMEKRQIDTVEWEEKRLRHVKKRQGSRAASASKANDKRCCSSCLQPACVGDCPGKRTTYNCCVTCHQPLCTGTCEETRYDQRKRQPRDDVGASLPTKTSVPRNCRTCQKRHTAKYINANQVLLGRPTSAFSTYSRGKGSAKPKDLRPKSAFIISECISKGIEKIGLDPLQPVPPPVPKPPRPRSRGGLLPGKSYSSNLKHSLTDLTVNRRKGSGKSRKQKPAVTV